MWTWLLGLFACAIMLIIVCASYVALFVPDEKQRRDGYRVLALVFSVVTGGTGLAALLLKLHDAGLI
jgi:hypothetical protein